MAKTTVGVPPKQGYPDDAPGRSSRGSAGWVVVGHLSVLLPTARAPWREAELAPHAAGEVAREAVQGEVEVGGRGQGGGAGLQMGAAA